MKINYSFLPVPRILLSDESLKDKDRMLLGLIIPLTYQKGYCFATNEYLAKELYTSKRTINYSLVNLKKGKWIVIKYVNKRRRIYLNEQKALLINSIEDDDNCNLPIAEYCNYNRKINNKKNNIRSLKEKEPIWMTESELCSLKPITEEDEEELQKLLNEYYGKE